MFKTKYVIISSDYSFPQSEYENYFTLNIDKYHPTAHKKVLLVTIESDVPTIIQTYNDITLAHLNNLILLSKLDETISFNTGYEGLSISEKDISAFEYITADKALNPLTIGDFGYEYQWINKHSSDISEPSFIIHDKIEELKAKKRRFR